MPVRESQRGGRRARARERRGRGERARRRSGRRSRRRRRHRHHPRSPHRTSSSSKERTRSQTRGSSPSCRRSPLCSPVDGTGEDGRGPPRRRRRKVNVHLYIFLSTPFFLWRSNALSSNSARPLLSKNQREALSKRRLVSVRGRVREVQGTELSECGRALTRRRGLRRALFFFFCFCFCQDKVERIVSRDKYSKNNRSERKLCPAGAI